MRNNNKPVATPPQDPVAQNIPPTGAVPGPPIRTAGVPAVPQPTQSRQRAADPAREEPNIQRMWTPGPSVLGKRNPN